MRTITLAVALALLAGPAVAQQQTFRNERGQITGSSSTSGNVTTFRDRSGRLTGSAERMRDGSVQYGPAHRLGDGAAALSERGELSGDEVDALVLPPYPARSRGQEKARSCRFGVLNNLKLSGL